MFLTPTPPGRPFDKGHRSPDTRSADPDAAVIAVRERQARDAFRHLTEGVSVDVIGPRLSGRSTIVDRVERLCAGAGMSTLTVSGVADALPYDGVRAALARAGAGQPAAPVPSSALVQRLGELGVRAILVDDADLLDAASWSAVRLAHRAFGITLLVTTAPVNGRPARSTAEVAGASAHLRLEPLDGSAVHDLLQAHLGGQVAPSLVGGVLMKSGGLVGVACALVRASIGTGRARQGDGAGLDAVEPWDDGLAAVYGALLSDLDPMEVDAVELLATIGTVEVEAAARLVGGELLERLESAGRVQMFTPHGVPLVAVNPPGLADFFARSTPGIRRRRIMAAMAAHGAEAGRIAIDPRATATPEPAGDDQLPFIARMFSETGAARLQRALTRWNSAPSVHTALPVITLGLGRSGDRHLLDRVIAGTPIDECAPRDELTFRYLRSRWAVQVSPEPAEAEAALVGGCAGSFRFRDALTALLIALRIERTGISTAALDELTELSRGDGANGQLARLALAFALSCGGDAEEALRLLPADDADGSELLIAHLQVGRGLALCAAGRFVEASTWASLHVDASVAGGERIALAGHAYVAVLSAAAMGQLDKALATAKLAISLGASAGCLLFDTDRALLNLTSIIALQLGKDAAAESFAAHARSLRGGSDALPFNAPGFVEAARQLHRGSPAKAAAMQRVLADDLHGRGLTFAADFATMLSLNAEFDRDLAARFRERGEVLGGARYLAYLDGRSALERQDADGLLDSVRRLRAHGARDEALMLATHARRILRDNGRNEEAEAAAAEISALLEAGASGATELGRTRLELTSRELELVRLVGAGLSNADIAAHLHISVRTVDTHLRNIRKKAGASSRDDLGMLATGD
ncbi:LuxR C-terminal-related transcriptional regulator [Leifsonia sp. F6_8S_P_1B]|uniref:LuxR C-terminal-related transcriptional regulator n=1 Tax=Leifsonia williamsii TaxID=3035919 RepID=A0ABT8KD26_9MICO|nr:LuxR family transcriptional regulator [Leifsonia williamsii]MDN4615365.1 LuxR C-terminal-related transcriptional regulator [Leifsonia williamsii]